MVGAVEFLRKAQGIKDLKDKEKIGYMIIDYLYEMDNKAESDLVAKVMAYKIKEDTDATK